jgi:hypothetical protein
MKRKRPKRVIESTLTTLVEEARELLEQAYVKLESYHYLTRDEELGPGKGEVQIICSISKKLYDEFMESVVPKYYPKGGFDLALVDIIEKAVQEEAKKT